MKQTFLIFIIVLMTVSSVEAADMKVPTFDLEKKIAYQQGQFGALYAHCGTDKEKVVIGGSLSVWRDETFRGYNGTAVERAALLGEFDDAADAVMSDASSCRNWNQQADATWRSVSYLSQYGSPGVVQR